MIDSLKKSLNAANNLLNQGDVGEVAERSGISRPTCSLYLNGKGVNDDTGIKVLEAARAIIRERQAKVEELAGTDN